MISYIIPDSLAGEITELESLIAGYKTGSVSDAQLKAHRVPFGVYEQRERGAFMIRVRTTGGIVSPSQLGAVADCAGNYGSGVVHLTTRQELQIHDVALDKIIPAIRALLPHGLSSRGGGGNTVRNIMASWDAGISPSEQFDVTPYVVALTSRLIAEPDSWVLPRKFKIAFSGGASDNALATVNDLGFIAVLRDGREGFRVYVAGGMGRQPQPGHLLHEWVDGSEVYPVAEAVKRVFDKYGNRRNRHNARLRFLWNALGREQFVGHYLHERDELVAAGAKVLAMIPTTGVVAETGTAAVETVEPAGFSLWRKRYVQEQKQQGLWSVIVPFFLGVVDAVTLRSFADAMRFLGDDSLRLTMEQNVCIRNIPERALPQVFRAILGTAPLSGGPSLPGTAIACAGAATCQLGLCRSRDALKGITDHLSTSGLDLDAFAGLKMKISGCPNTCGQHMVADLGFFGKTGSAHGHSYPAYGIVAGTVIGDGATRLARRLGEIPARMVPEFVKGLLSTYGKVRDRYPSFADFIDGEGADWVAGFIRDLQPVPSPEADPAFYTDWGAQAPFSTAGRGGGECSAGLFDMIDLDLKRLADVRPQLLAGDPGAIRESAILAAHMLLVTRGLHSETALQTLEHFEKEFIDGGLIDARHRALICALRDQVALPGETEVTELVADVVALYQTLDDSLRLVKPAVVPAVDVSKDLRGVPCPMNFVKTKMALAGLTPGGRLAVLLDDGAPMENVPGSVEQEGHRILEQRREGDSWRIIIEKGVRHGG